MLAYKVVEKIGDEYFSAYKGGLKYIPGKKTYPLPNTGIFCFDLLSAAQEYCEYISDSDLAEFEVWKCEIEKFDRRKTPQFRGSPLINWDVDYDDATNKWYVYKQKNWIGYQNTIFASYCILLERIENESIQSFTTS